MRAARAISFLLLFTPATAVAQTGLNLAWNDCIAGGGSSDVVFACDSNTGPNFLLQMSVVVPPGITALQGVTVEVGACMVGTPLPWWQTLAGQCRANAISMTFDPTANWTSCPDLWQGNPVVQFFQVENSTGHLKLNGTAVLPEGTTLAVPADGTEIYLGRIEIRRSKTIGAGSCAGCGYPVGLALFAVRVLQVRPAPDFWITQPATRNWASWNLGWDPGGWSLCYVPTQNRTWGAIKSLYR